MCKNYSMSRNFDSGRPKEDFNIRVVGVIKKAKNNQLRGQSYYKEVKYLACVLRAYPELLYEEEAFRYLEFSDRSRYNLYTIIQQVSFSIDLQLPLSKGLSEKAVEKC